MSQRPRLRLVVLQVLVLSLLATLFGRLWYLQVLSGERYDRAASANRVREVIKPAVRGQILDDRGRPLVNNRTALVVSVSRTELLRQPDEGEAVLRRLAGVIGMEYEDLRQRVRLCAPGIEQPCWNGSPYQPIPVTDNADTEMALQIMERREDFPGVTAELQAVRQFPKAEGALATHMLGYLKPVSEEELERQRGEGVSETELTHTSLVGAAGLERQYDRYLRGEAGITRVAVDHMGRVVGTVDETPSTAGNHLVTSIDAKVQAVAERELLEAIKRARGKHDKITKRNYEADSGSVVVMDVRTGRIVAMASYPSYDPAVWIGGITQKEYDQLVSEETGAPILSRATQGEFAPASTFKVITTAAAAENGFSLKSRYQCGSSYQVGNRSFGNYESRSYGSITLRRAIEVSCDTVFYGIAHRMWLRDGGVRAKNPKEPILAMAEAFGLGKQTGIDLPDEADGLIADRAFKQERWERRKDYWCEWEKTDYAKVKKEDPQRAEYLKRLMAENCVDGWRFRAGDAVINAIGQGETLVTPLQLTRVYAAVANGGTLWQPQIAKAVVSPSGEVLEEFEPKATGKVPVSKRNLEFIQDAVTAVSVRGTAAGVYRGFPIDQIPMASKTGTGEVQGKQTTSWFASYAPADDPQYAIVMMVSQGGTGSGTSGPSVRKIYEALFGVVDDTVDPSKAILPNGVPPTELPEIKPNGQVVAPGAGR